MKLHVLSLGNRAAQNLTMLAISLAALALFWERVRAAVTLAIADDRYLPVIVAPFLSLFLIYWLRRDVFPGARFSFRLGLPLLSLVLLFSWIVAHRPSHDDEIAGVLPVAIGVVLVWIAAFILCYGLHSFRMAIYPLCCLVLVLPAPLSWLDRISRLFQEGSASMSYAILGLIGMPVLRDGMVFSIPGLSFNIAPECSGIRSGLAFVLVGVLVGRLFLRSGWSRAVLILLTVPIAILKNSIRIVVITSLGAYVNRTFIDGPFHHQYSGIVFAPIDFMLFLPLLIGIAKFEKRTASNQSAPQTVPVGPHEALDHVHIGSSERAATLRSSPNPTWLGPEDRKHY